MIILISPAKTFRTSPENMNFYALFKNESFFLLEQLKQFSKESLQKNFSISSTLSNNIYESYHHFSPTPAIYTYDGTAFRSFHMEKHVLNDFIEPSNHLYILSGLYGLLRPLDGITPYRLEMQSTILGNLYHYWHDAINNYLKTHHSEELLINLASKEYSKVLDDSLGAITIDFAYVENSRLRRISMTSKKMRGLFASYLFKNTSLSLLDIKKIVIDDFSYNPNYSTDKILLFTKAL